MKSRTVAEERDAWLRQAQADMKRRENDRDEMNALADIVEGWVKGERSEALMLLAFHHVAMAHGAYARKKTLSRALKSSIEELSQVAPAIFPPDRVVRFLRPKKKGSTVSPQKAAEPRPSSTQSPASDPN